MLRIDFRTIQMFLAVYHLRSVTKAAERDNIAPSAVSKRIHDLELEFGVQLFDRHPHGVTPTLAGERLAEHAQRLIDVVNETAADLSNFAQGIRGEVRVYAHGSAISQYLPGDIMSFSNTYPEVRVTLREATSQTVVQATLDGFADIGIFAGNIAAREPLKILPYREDRLVAFVPGDHPLADREAIDFKELENSAYISFEEGSSLRALVFGAAKAMGLQINKRIEVTTFVTALKMVEAGFGIAVLPAGIVDSFGSNLSARGIPLTNDWARRRLVICVREDRTLTGAARLMLEHLFSSRSASEGDRVRSLEPAGARGRARQRLSRSHTRRSESAAVSDGLRD